MTKKIRVVELFAGVGGFRLGLEGWKGKSASSGYTKKFTSPYEIVWSNQWEPSGGKQYASDIYRHQWPDSDHSNKDIFSLADDADFYIPPHEMLVGGFPCQDYSVANTLKRSGGLEGRKGVLWWAIHKILKRTRDEGRPTKYLILENVDRLLKSPKGQRGRDFAVMLASLHQLGYAVEWRVINAADYGMPQRRRRIFLMAYHESAMVHEKLNRLGPQLWFQRSSLMNRAFPIQSNWEFDSDEIHLRRSLSSISNDFNKNSADKPSPFRNAGIMVDGSVLTAEVSHIGLSEQQRKAIGLGRFLEREEVPDEFWVPRDQVFDEKNGWQYHKGPKSKTRVDKETGYIYEWAEGGMGLYDDLEKPARTIITSEGGRSPSRSKHLIKIDGRFRRLTPKELERVSMFPDDHTRIAQTEDGETYLVSDSRRAFLIGNALVVGIVESLGNSLVAELRNTLEDPALVAGGHKAIYEVSLQNIRPVSKYSA